MYPILIEFGPITIFSLWFLIAIGFIAGSLVFIHLAKRTRVKLNILTDNSFAVFAWALIASRLFFVFTHPDYYFYKLQLSSFINLFAIWDKGLSFWGAVIGWFCSILYIARKGKESPLRIFDITIPAVMIGMFFGNIGALLEGINYGMPTNLPWGVAFRSANVKYISPLHPTQLYSAIYALALGIFLFMILKKLRSAMPGFLFELGVLMFGIFKFLEEFFRGDETFKLFSIRVPQIISALAVIIAAYLIYERYGKDPQHILKTFVRKFLKRNPGAIAGKTPSLQSQIP